MMNDELMNWWMLRMCILRISLVCYSRFGRIWGCGWAGEWLGQRGWRVTVGCCPCGWVSMRVLVGLRQSVQQNTAGHRKIRGLWLSRSVTLGRVICSLSLGCVKEKRAARQAEGKNQASEFAGSEHVRVSESRRVRKKGWKKGKAG